MQNTHSRKLLSTPLTHRIRGNHENAKQTTDQTHNETSVPDLGAPRSPKGSAPQRPWAGKGLPVQPAAARRPAQFEPSRLSPPLERLRLPARPGTEQGRPRRFRLDNCVPHAPPTSSAPASSRPSGILRSPGPRAGCTRSPRPARRSWISGCDLFGRYQKVLHSALDSLENLNRPLTRRSGVRTARSSRA